MSRRARVWLAERAGPVPPTLQAVMENAAEAGGSDGSTVPDRLHVELAEAALLTIDDALRLGDDRSAALPLLAADALVTFACETAADSDVDAAAVLADVWDIFAPARLDQLLPEAPR